LSPWRGSEGCDASCYKAKKKETRFRINNEHEYSKIYSNSMKILECRERVMDDFSEMFSSFQET
jgi:hypothetical protein